MALRINTAARNAAADAVTALIDPSDPGVLRVYTGTQPAGPGSAAVGDLLLEFDLSDPAFAGASNGTAALDVDPIPAATGEDAGTAGWFRILTATEASGTGLGVIDGSVTATDGGGELELNTTTVSVGLDVEITSGSITMPSGA